MTGAKGIEQELRAALEAYLTSYLTRRDLQKAVALFSPTIHGVGTGHDEFVPERRVFLEIYERDFRQAPNAIVWEQSRLQVAVLSDTVGITTCELHLHTQIQGQEIHLNNLRQSLVWKRHESGRWVIEHLHISFPSTEHGQDESYPNKELEARNRVLARLVEKRTAQLSEALEEQRQLANTDRLTGMNNRPRIEELASTECLGAQRYGHPVSSILVDVDWFKRINDQHGHLIGDSVLKAFADIITARLRAVDHAGRWGGEEFLIICPHIGIEGALALARGLRETIAAHPFPKIGPWTASIGVSQYRPGETLQDFFGRTDAALYRAKELGRNRVEVAPNGP